MQVVPVEGSADLNRFVRFPRERYRGDPYWVAPLETDERARLTPGKNPYFEHAEAAYFLARHDGEVAGRVAVSVDRNYDAFHGERQATFGFFESTTAEAALALLGEAETWARARGVRHFRGPLSFTTNDECGLLIDGFERRPAILMPYNPPEYAGWIEAAGFRKAKDLYSFVCEVPERIPGVLERMASLARRRDRVTTRPLDMRRFDEELARVKEIYNSAWEKNWGFVPMTENEIDHLAGQLKPAIVPEIVRFAEVEGVPVGFGLLLPDLNAALATIRGRLYPWGIFRLLWAMRGIRRFRVMALGIRPDWRKRGAAPLLIVELIDAARAKGYTSCEIGWTLEDNHAVNRLVEATGGVRASTYRIYERRLLP